MPLAGNLQQWHENAAWLTVTVYYQSAQTVLSRDQNTKHKVLSVTSSPSVLSKKIIVLD